MNVVVVGSGIVGLATARALALAGNHVTVLEKEGRIASHQTGRNSGVIHSGLYYKPGSDKAKMSVAGVKSMTAYAKEKDIRHEICGKLVVATREDEIPRLHTLAERAVANGVPARLVSMAEAREIEPNVSVREALLVESTGIIDYPAVCEALAADIEELGGEIRLNAEFKAARHRGGRVDIIVNDERLTADVLVNCAGLYSDRVAAACGLTPEARIIPFRGEYFQLRPEREHLVKGLIYPVPDPSLPFLGVHLTKMVDGSVHAGPNAVLALRREGYSWGEINVKELAETLTWPGLWKMGVHQIGNGVNEPVRSFSRTVFAKSLARLVPGIEAHDLVRAEAGVRAQALRRDGAMVDDFLIQRAPGQFHVLNAPSPAATCALEIGQKIASEVAA